MFLATLARALFPQKNYSLQEVLFKVRQIASPGMRPDSLLYLFIVWAPWGLVSRYRGVGGTVR